MTDTDLENPRGHHPGVGQYVEIGVILAVVTAIEVALFYIDIPQGVTIPSLLVLTLLKFALVVLWFMHLRFDSSWFRRVFTFGLVLAVIVFTATVALLYYGA